MSGADTILHVAVAVIVNSNEQVLLTRRPQHVHQGGLWEFPGGKVEAGEEVADALRRELQEELGITSDKCSPLIRVRHDYPDRRVLLDVHRVDRYAGEPYGREGQMMQWFECSQLAGLAMPAANRPIVGALSLPERYLITPAALQLDVLLQGLESCLQSGISLVQYRDPQLDDAAYLSNASAINELVQAYDARLMLNRAAVLSHKLPLAGIHLNSARLMACHERPVADDSWLAASCHNADEIKQANRIGADFVVLSPVLPTKSHAHAEPLGWPGFQQLTELAHMPVYALGGQSVADIATARQHGGQGIAAIRALWGGD